MQRKLRRRGQASLDAVLCAGVALPIAAALFWLLQSGCKAYFLHLSTVVGWPLL
jgi:hypothetical protein